MDPAPSAVLVAGRGIVGNADQGRRRQVTLLEEQIWRDLTGRLGSKLDPGRRRANLMLDGLQLEKTRGRIFSIGPCLLRIGGETKPCEQMDEALPGLQELMWPNWAGGAYAEVLTGGEIRIGDPAGWVSEEEAVILAMEV
jgi:MOSC domain-containing protein YiiM